VGVGKLDLPCDETSVILKKTGGRRGGNAVVTWHGRESQIQGRKKGCRSRERWVMAWVNIRGGPSMEGEKTLLVKGGANRTRFDNSTRRENRGGGGGQRKK